MIKKILILSFFFPLATQAGVGLVGHENKSSIYRAVKQRVMAQDRHIRQSYTYEKIIKLADVLTFAAKKSGEPVRYMLALMETESNLFQKAYNKNSDGTIDLGYWQQSSRYANKRMMAVYGREIKESDYQDMEISTNLMLEARKECKAYTGLWLAICYNCPVCALKSKVTSHGVRWLKNLGLQKWN